MEVVNHTKVDVVHTQVDVLDTHLGAVVSAVVDTKAALEAHAVVVSTGAALKVDSMSVDREVGVKIELSERVLVDSFAEVAFVED